MSEVLSVGTVFKWKNFPYSEESEKRDATEDRWFVYIGESSELDTGEVISFICTTTCQLDYYKPGGKRENHKDTFTFDDKYDFNRECILDLHFLNIQVKEQLIKNKDIEPVFSLDEDTLRRIYKIILSACRIRYIHKCQIWESFNRIGITGLKKPKQR